jgi:hypothetical protein
MFLFTTDLAIVGSAAPVVTAQPAKSTVIKISDPVTVYRNSVGTVPVGIIRRIRIKATVIKQGSVHTYMR